MKNLVAVRLSDGLGNQMFSYATGLAIAKRTNGDLRFDIRYFRRPRARPLQLPAFGLQLRNWTPLWWRVEAKIAELSRGRFRPGPTRLIEQADFEPGVLSIDAPCYLKGYFQSWRYFEGIAPLVRKSFDTSRLSTPRCADMEERITHAQCAVMVHVRRGDFTPYPDIFPLLMKDYYERARGRLELDGQRPAFFLFSDDPKAATDMLSDWPNLVPVVGMTSLEDFRLMSLCRHFIIANSTFSWWAAWLGSAADKRVAAPSQWLGRAFRPTDMDARLPPEWIRA